MSAVRVLIAHHGLMRVSLRMALNHETEICGEAGDAERAVVEAQRAQPEVCLVGWDIPGGCLNAVQGILRVAPDAAVVVLSDNRDVDDLLAAVRAGAVGYLPGSLDEEQLRRVVRGVAAQEAAVPRTMVRELILELRSATSIGGVTEREAQVLGMLRRGRSTAQIANRLGISPITVRRYISDLMRKLGVGSRGDLVSIGQGSRLDGTGIEPARPSSGASLDADLVTETRADAALRAPRPAPERYPTSDDAAAHGVRRGLDPVWHFQLRQDA